MADHVRFQTVAHPLLPFIDCCVVGVDCLTATQRGLPKAINHRAESDRQAPTPSAGVRMRLPRRSALAAGVRWTVTEAVARRCQRTPPGRG